MRVKIKHDVNDKDFLLLMGFDLDIVYSELKG